MPKIKPLPPETIAAIAAGEVIQRPANVVKELIENALDAQASYITINLENSGLSLIEVIDNGRGIPSTQLDLALQAHTTSKLTLAADLEQITSHGFRGEALFSIAQVAQLTLKSRPASQQAGAVITSHKHTVSPVTPVGMPKGSQVRVTNLFARMPVRQEFLRRSSTQLRRIVELVTHFALVNPQVGFELNHNQRQLFLLASGQSLVKRIQDLLGTQLYSQLIPISHKDQHIQITGFISQPSLWSKRPEKQYLSINKRPVKHLGLNKIITQITNQQQANTLHPLYVMDLSVPSNQLDINIHPQKETVEIYQLDQLATLFESVLNPLLKQRPLTYSSFQPKSLTFKDHQGQYRVHRFRQGVQELIQSGTSQQPQLTGDILQLANLYLVAPTSDGLLLVDQHALHERILYDQYKAAFIDNQSALLQEKITVNLVFDLSPQEAIMVPQQKAYFEKYQLVIVPFGANSFQITQVPKLFADHNVVELIKEILNLTPSSQNSLDPQTDALLASMACRAAIKAGDFISLEMRQQLIEALLSRTHSGTCPHGRPVSIRISLSEFHKLFKRQ